MASGGMIPSAPCVSLILTHSKTVSRLPQRLPNARRHQPVRGKEKVNHGKAETPTQADPDPVVTDKPNRAAWFKGGDTRCQTEPRKAARPYRLVLLGAPGVGKGTQAQLLCDNLSVCPLSTGDIFRSANGLPAGERSSALEQAVTFMRRGDLVPDETVLDLIRERVRCLRCGGGWLLDGFPRTVVQAKALSELLQKEKIALDAVLNYELPIDTLVARLSGRRICPGCKAVFHVTGRPPRAEGRCDHCGSELFQREDDRPDAVRVRMEVYERSTKPLIDYYHQRGLLLTIEAEGRPETICRRTLDALAAAR